MKKSTLLTAGLRACVLSLLAAAASLAGPKLSLEQPAGTVLTGGIVHWGDTSSSQANVPAGLTGVVEGH